MEIIKYKRGKKIHVGYKKKKYIFKMIQVPLNERLTDIKKEISGR